LHGFARNSDEWDLVSLTGPSGTGLTQNAPTSVTLSLKDSEKTREKGWPHRFELQLTVTLDAFSLSLEVLCLNNNKAEPFDLTFAFHNYLNVDDICTVHVEGLQSCRYQDKVKQFNEFTEETCVLQLDGGEVDKIYLRAPNRVKLVNRSANIAVLLDKDCLDDVVIWNIGKDKVLNYTDMGADDWKKYICIETAQISTPVTVLPNEVWSSKQTLTKISL